jgi:hypothetical protein
MKHVVVRRIIRDGIPGPAVVLSDAFRVAKSYAMVGAAVDDDYRHHGRRARRDADTVTACGPFGNDRYGFIIDQAGRRTTYMYWSVPAAGLKVGDTVG